VRSLESNLALIGHVHTGGNPGRRQLDHRQETNWTAIAGTLVHRGYDGWVGHEFLPRGDAIAALRQAHDLFTPSPPR
jgi:hydroxypyruvate isomerase